MNKTEFIDALKNGLRDYSSEEIKQYTDYYTEMIDDRTEEGLSEEEAVADIGTPEDAVAQIKSENPINKKSPSLKTGQLVLIVAGSPVWFSLLVAAAAVIISLLVAVFAVVVTLYAGAVSLGAAGVAGAVALIPLLIHSNLPGGMFLLGSGLICAGLCILSFMGLNRLVKRLIPALKKLLSKLASCLKRKERTK